MKISFHPISFIFLFESLATASFYDNPEQDPIPEGGSPLAELEKKWSTDV